jgi:hypothetical protein
VQAPFYQTWNEFSIPIGGGKHANAAVMATLVLSDDLKRDEKLLLGVMLASKKFEGACYVGRCEIPVDEEGVDLSKHPFLSIYEPELRQLSTRSADDARLLIGIASEVVLFAWALLACRNVQATEIHPSTRLEKAKVDPCRVVYRELIIKPVPGQERKLRSHREDERGTALHLVRGHFKNYAERGLFGRNKGWWWWGPHTAGRADFGTVLKSYAVEGLDGVENGKSN